MPQKSYVLEIRMVIASAKSGETVTAMFERGACIWKTTACTLAIIRLLESKRSSLCLFYLISRLILSFHAMILQNPGGLGARLKQASICGVIVTLHSIRIKHMRLHLAYTRTTGEWTYSGWRPIGGAFACHAVAEIDSRAQNSQQPPIDGWVGGPRKLTSQLSFHASSAVNGIPI